MKAAFQAKEISMDKLTKIYVTKNALTAGAFSVMAEVKPGGRSAFWGGGWDRSSAYGKDFWLTEAEALADCERRRTAKLASIEKQTKKLKAMTFEIKEG